MRAAAASAPLVQVRLTDLRRVVRVEAVQRACAELKDAIRSSEPSNEEELLRILRQLDTFYITFDTLQETGLGRIIYRLHKSASPAVKELATTLYVKWRADCKEAAERAWKQKAASARRSSTAPAHEGEVAGTAVDRSILLESSPVDLEVEMGEWEQAASVASHRKRPRESTGSVASVASVAVLHAEGGDTAEDEASRHVPRPRRDETAAPAAQAASASRMSATAKENGVRVSSMLPARVPSGSFRSLELTKV